MPKPLTTDGYKTLVRKIARELSELEFFVKRRTAQGYWNVGKFIHEHLLENKDRAEYGRQIFERLSSDVDRDASTLSKMLRFYRAYPILARGPKFNWSHYRTLMTVKDKEERHKLEKKIIQKDWDVAKLQKYLNIKRDLAASGKEDRPVPQLTFTRGRLHTYQIIKAKKPLAGKGPLALDLGFRQEHVIPKNAAKFKEGDFVELLWEGEELADVKKVETGLKPVFTDNLFTYKAYVDKVTDADTLIVEFDFQLDVSIGQKLRLRGINCPEIDTPEGQRAKRFVESRLKDCDFIIVKTYKDRSDKFDRYLADIFYQEGEDDPSLVAAQGTFLNQELLDEHLASVY